MPPGRIRDTSMAMEVEGLEQLRRELRRANPELAKELQKVNKALAEEIVLTARSRFYRTVAEVDSSHARVGSARVKRSSAGSISKSARSIRANATQRGASVVGGGPKAPSFFGHEFGGGARPRTRQFPVHRGRDGYVLYPTVRREVEEVEPKWHAIFDELFETREAPL